MPQMDGLALTKAIKEILPQVPVILLSSIGDEHNGEYAHLFNAVLTKPVKQHILEKNILQNLQTLTEVASNTSTVHQKMPVGLSQEYPLKILIAEDNVINQRVIQHILQKMGYYPEIAGDGEEAARFSGTNNYDLILMDMQMPIMDGLDATRKIRKMAIRQPLIAALTANTLQGDREECLEAGMNDYIGKPVKVEELINKLKEWHLTIVSKAI